MVQSAPLSRYYLAFHHHSYKVFCFIGRGLTDVCEINISNIKLCLNRYLLKIQNQNILELPILGNSSSFHC